MKDEISCEEDTRTKAVDTVAESELRLHLKGGKTERKLLATYEAARAAKLAEMLSGPAEALVASDTAWDAAVDASWTGIRGTGTDR